MHTVCALLWERYMPIWPWSSRSTSLVLITVMSQEYHDLASQITDNSTVCSTACLHEQWTKHQCSILVAHCDGKLLVNGPWWEPTSQSHVDSPSQKASYDVSFDVILNTLLNKQSSCHWFEMLWCACSIIVRMCGSLKSKYMVCAERGDQVYLYKQMATNGFAVYIVFSSEKSEMKNASWPICWKL